MTELINIAKSFDQSINNYITSSDIISNEEFQRLIESMKNTETLSSQELKVRHLLLDRNIAILTLFYKYGLTINEVVQISMKDISFIQNTLKLYRPDPHIIQLQQEDKLLILSYYKKIPEPVKPKYYTEDPLFVSMDFNRKTFKWVYETEQPQRLHIRSIQKMINKEAQRSGLKRKITAQYLRNSYIINSLISGTDEKKLMKELNITPNYFKRYTNYLTNGAV